MQAIGIDTHKATLAACAVDELGRPSPSGRSPTIPAGHAALLGWVARASPGARIGLEGSACFGAAAARSLLAAGEDVVARCRRSSAIASGCGPDGPARATRAMRSRSPG